MRVDRCVVMCISRCNPKVLSRQLFEAKAREPNSPLPNHGLPDRSAILRFVGLLRLCKSNSISIGKPSGLVIDMHHRLGLWRRVTSLSTTHLRRSQRTSTTPADVFKIFPTNCLRKSLLTTMAGTELNDPKTVTGKRSPAFPLTKNNLQDLMEYHFVFGNQISLVSKVDLPAGAHLCNVTTHTPVPLTTWSSVQSSVNTHFEFNSALVYANHSCAPTLDLEVFAPDAEHCYPNGIAGEFRVTQKRDLRKGDDLTWFYPSTEWQNPGPFECRCGAPDNVCIGVEAGSKFLPKDVLDRYFINKHVRYLAEEQGYFQQTVG